MKVHFGTVWLTYLHIGLCICVNEVHALIIDTAKSVTKLAALLSAISFMHSQCFLVLLIFEIVTNEEISIKM